MSKRDAITPSAAWLSGFCSSDNSFGLLFAQGEAWHYRMRRRALMVEELEKKFGDRVKLVGGTSKRDAIRLARPISQF
eukprot:4245877-Pyramimonas_sp.AAC.1